MIQRIQTIYLFFASLFMGISLFIPIVTFTTKNEVWKLTSFSLSTANISVSTVWLGILMVVATVLPLVIIFLFKNRQLQVRLCGVEAVVLLGVLVLIGIYFFLGDRLLADFVITDRMFGWAAPMPIVSMILVLLATRAIYKDEVLVRSLDRIR